MAAINNRNYFDDDEFVVIPPGAYQQSSMSDDDFKVIPPNENQQSFNPLKTVAQTGAGLLGAAAKGRVNKALFPAHAIEAVTQAPGKIVDWVAPKTREQKEYEKYLQDTGQIPKPFGVSDLSHKIHQGIDWATNQVAGDTTPKNLASKTLYGLAELGGFGGKEGIKELYEGAKNIPQAIKNVAGRKEGVGLLREGVRQVARNPLLRDTAIVGSSELAKSADMGVVGQLITGVGTAVGLGIAGLEDPSKTFNELLAEAKKFKNKLYKNSEEGGREMLMDGTDFAKKMTPIIEEGEGKLTGGEVPGRAIQEQTDNAKKLLKRSTEREVIAERITKSENDLAEYVAMSSREIDTLGESFIEEQQELARRYQHAIEAQEIAVDRATRGRSENALNLQIKKMNRIQQEYEKDLSALKERQRRTLSESIMQREAKIQAGVDNIEKMYEKRASIQQFNAQDIFQFDKDLNAMNIQKDDPSYGLFKKMRDAVDAELELINKANPELYHEYKTAKALHAAENIQNNIKKVIPEGKIEELIPDEKARLGLYLFVAPFVNALGKIPVVGSAMKYGATYMGIKKVVPDLLRQYGSKKELEAVIKATQEILATDSRAQDLLKDFVIATNAKHAWKGAAKDAAVNNAIRLSAKKYSDYISSNY